MTGAAGGLGAASALRLSREGCRVAVVDLDGDGARKVARSLPGMSIAITADVSVEEDVDRYLDEATHSFGRIDLHHLNAGMPPLWTPASTLGAWQADKKKKIVLTLLVHPEWLRGSPRTTPDGTPFGGAAQDDAASTALWNAERVGVICGYWRCVANCPTR